MKKIIASSLVVFSLFSQAQNNDSINVNTVDKMLTSDKKLNIGGYAQIDYNQPFDKDIKKLGALEVHRMILFVGYNYNENTKFISEIEFEHVNELYVEQAFLEHKITPWLSFRGGLLLVPMGIINEYHEPPLYNGVERPVIDNIISPTTWRELGAGFTGQFIDASVKYQIYAINGFNGYDSKGILNGKDALRKGRQKGINTYMSTPNLALRTEYYGLRSVRLGLSGYFGDTQSKLYHDIKRNDEVAMAKADSSVVGVNMIGLDARYQRKALELKGQLYYVSLSNTEAYNKFTASGSKLNDLGRAMLGYYAEVGYNVLQGCNTEKQLVPFVRYEHYNTHFAVDDVIKVNDAYHNKILTTGFGYKLTSDAVLKLDVSFVKNNKPDAITTKTMNAGIGLLF